MSAVRSTSSWSSISSGTKVAVILGGAVAAAVIVWLNFFS